MAARLQTVDASLVAAATGGTAAAPAAGGLSTGRDASPLTGWHRVLGDWLLVGGTTAACHVLSAAAGLLLRALLDPAQMGIWQALKLFRSYGNYANLGVSKGAARELTVALGRGDTSAAERGLNLAFTVNTLTSVLYGGVLVGAGVWIGWFGGIAWAGAWAVGLVAVGAMAVLGRYVTFHVTILRSKLDFITTSQLSILEAVLTLVVCGLATWRFGLAGLYGGTLVVMLGTLVFVTRRRAANLAWAWDGAEIRRLIAVGSPILLAGTAGTLFRSLDKLMILGYLSDREFQLGCYSLALMVTTQLYGLGNMLSMVMGPRYGEKYGRSGDRRQVARLAARATEFQAAVMALPAALAIVAAPPILNRLLPEYGPGLAPLAWLVPGVCALALALPASQYLVAIDRQGRALFAVVAATALGAVGNHLALAGGYGLVGVAAATALCYLGYFLVAMRISIWIELGHAQRLRCAGMLGLILLPAMASATVLERLWPGAAADWSTTAAKVGAVAIVWTLSAMVAWRRGHWRETFRRRSAN